VSTRNRLLFVSMIALLCGFGASCSSSSPKQAQGLQFVSPTTGPVIELATTPQTVNLTTNEPVDWSLQNGTGCSKAQGTLSVSEGSSTTYTPPVTSTANCFSGPLTISVVATSVADPSQTAIMVISIVQTSPQIDTVSGVSLLPDVCPAAGTVIDASIVPTLNHKVAQVGASYLVTIGDKGFFQNPPAPNGVAPFTWKMTGSLPTGLSMYPGTDTSNIVISGTPTSAGCDSNSTFTLQLTDATGVSSAPVTYTIAVIPASLKIQNPTLSSIYSTSADSNAGGIPYAPAVFVASNGQPPYSWLNLASLNLPPPGMHFGPASAGSNVGVLYGDSGPGSSGAFGSAYTNQFQVTDTQTPYPASAITSQIGFSAKVLPQFCSQQVDEGGNLTSADSVEPSAANGGQIGGNFVPAASYLQGSFAFLLRGFDATGGPIVTAGSATLDGAGNVTAGEVDVTDHSGHRLLSIQPGSSYVVGLASFGVGSPTITYNRGCMALALKDSSNVVTTTNFAFSLGGCSNHYTENQITTTATNACGMKQSSGQNIAAGQFTRGHIIQFDCTTGTTCTGSGALTSGIMRLQDATSFSSAVNGPYAFGMSGQGAAGGRYAIAGSFQAASGALSSAAADFDDAGTLGTQLTGGSGSLSSIDASGRVSGSLSVGSAKISLAGYVVSKNEVMLLSTDTLAATHPIIGGEAIATASSFNNLSLLNSHMFHLAGTTNGKADVSIGLLQFDGVSSFSGTQSSDQSGTVGTATLSGTYLVDSATGRATFLASQQGQNLGSHPFVGYVIPASATISRADCSNSEASCVTGFLVGTDATAQDGVLEFQTPTIAPPPPFTNLFIIGDYVYGTDEPLTALSPTVEGNAPAKVSSTSTTSGSLGFGGTPITQDVYYGDANYCLQAGCYQFIPGNTLAGSYSVNANGTGTFGNGKASVTNGSVVFYIDQSTAKMSGGSILVDPQPSIVVAEQ